MLSATALTFVILLSAILAVSTTFAQYLFTIGTNNILIARKNSSSPETYVCDDRFTHQTAVGFCNLLGATNLNKVYYSSASVEADFNKIIGLDEVTCPANATNFETDCSYQTQTDCGPSEAIQLFCNSRSLQFRLSNTQRLLQIAPSGPASSGAFRNVAFNNFNQQTAEMMCIMGGYDITNYNVSFFNTNFGDVKYFNVSCPLTAVDFSQDCDFVYNPDAVNMPGSTSVGLDCGTTRKPLEFSLGQNNLLLANYIGFTNQKFTTCDDGFGMDEAIAICNSLAPSLGIPLDNIEPSFWVNRSSLAGAHYPIGMWNVDCPSSSSSSLNFSSCIYQTNPNCNQFENIYMSCSPVIRPDYDFWIDKATGKSLLYARPASASSSTPGDLVCDDNMNQVTAQRICYFMSNNTMTDFSKVLWWKSNLDFQTYSYLRLGLSEVVCKSSATSFSNCSRKIRGEFSCVISEAVSLSCDGTGVDFDFRVGDGRFPPSSSSDSSLYAAIKGTGNFMPVGPNQMSQTTVNGICNYLGFTNTSAFRWWTASTGQTTNVFMDNLVCPSSVNSFSMDCSYSFPTPGTPAQQQLPVQMSCGDVRNPFQFQFLDNNTNLLLAKSPIKNSNYTSVCDDSFNVASAQLICRVLGFGDGSNAAFSITTAPSQYLIGLESVVCPASASTFADCSYSTSHDCTQREAIALDCNASIPHFEFSIEPETSLLLVKQVGVDANFGNVCDDYFSTSSAAAICRKIGYQDLSRLYWYTFTASNSSRSILMSNIECTTDAASTGKFSLCTYKLLDPSGDVCKHSEDIALSCDGMWLDFQTQVTSSATKILVASASTRWSYIGGYIDQSVANVICREHGYVNESAFGFSILKNFAYDVLINNVSCPLGARTISECNYIITQSQNRFIQDVASIQCGTQRAPWTFSVDKNQGGLVLVYPPASNEFGYVGIDGFNSASAFFVCNKTQNMIGLTATYTAEPLNGRRALLNYVECPTFGTPATNVEDCSPTEYPTFASALVRVNCDVPAPTTTMMPTSSGAPPPPALPIMFGFPDASSSLPPSLLLAKSSTTGQVLGTVCADWFDIDTARVLCMTIMNYSTDGTRIAWKKAGTQYFSGDIAADNLECPPTAQSLNDCSFITDKNSINCDHTEDVLLYCDTITQGSPIPMKTSTYNGKSVLQVDIAEKNYYGAVEFNPNLSPQGLSCTCQKLGFKAGGNFSQSMITNYNGWTSMTNVDCTDFNSPAQCHTNCTYSINYDYGAQYNVTAIDCGTDRQDYSFQLKSDNLVVAKAPTDEAYGPICATTGFRLDTAQYLCREKLGYEMTTNMNVRFYLGDATNSLGNSPYPTAKLSNIDCPLQSTDDFTKACLYDTFAFCNLSTSALFIDCNAPVEPPVPQDEVRFRINSQGILEGYNASASTTTTTDWYPYCSDFFDQTTAIAVCSFMGTPSANPTFYSSGQASSADLMVSELVCPSGASSLADCTFFRESGCAFGERMVHLNCNQPQINISFALGTNGLLLASRSDNPGVQGTVCNDGMSYTNAVQICSVLGYPQSNIEWWTLSSYSTLPVMLESISCPDYSTGYRVTDFTKSCNFSVNTDCSNLEAVALSCGSTTARLKVQFSIGDTSGAGDNNHVLYASAAGSVLPGYIRSSGFDISTAHYVCASLGYTDNASVTFSTTTVTTRFAFFNYFRCNENASRIHDCTYQLGRESMSQSSQSVVTINCGASRRQYSVMQEPNMRIRVTSPGNLSGTMCSDGVTRTTVQGLCKIITGDSVAASNVGWWRIGGATGSILLDSTVCSASVNQIEDCDYSTTSDCNHNEDLAIACDTTTPGLFQFMINNDDETTNDNTVMVETPGTTSPRYVCADSMDAGTAQGICSIMEKGGGQSNFSAFAVSDVSSIGLRTLVCPTDALSIFDCQFSVDAGHCSTALMLSCNAPPPSTMPPSTTPAALRLRISDDGQLQGYDTTTSDWAPVCSDYFDADTASGVCGILGLSRTNPSFSNYLDGVSGALPVSDLVCERDASSISECDYNAAPGCTNGEQAILLSCQKPDVDVTFTQEANGLLVGTRSNDGLKGTVCNDGFTQDTAKGICKVMMNQASPNAQAWTLATYSNYPVVLDSVICPTSASSFQNDCNFSTSADCSNLEAIAVSCDGTGLSVSFSQATNNDLLVTATGSVTPTFVGGTTISADTATAVCKMIGYISGINPTVGTRKASTRYTLLNGLGCPATATSLSQCTSYTLGNEMNTAQSVDIVTLDCGAGAVREAYKVKLEGTRVRVQAPGSSIWGTACDDGMNMTTAQGLCKIITGNPSPNVAFWNIQGTGPIVVESIGCPTTASSLNDCSFSTTTDCSHNEDLGLACDTTQSVFSFSVDPNNNSLMVSVPSNNGAVGTVCGDFIDQTTALSLCYLATGKQAASATIQKQPVSSTATQNILLRSISCPSTAQSIFDCSFSQIGACSSTLSLVCASETTVSSMTATAPTGPTASATTMISGTNTPQPSSSPSSSTTTAVSQNTQSMTAMSTTTTTTMTTTTAVPSIQLSASFNGTYDGAAFTNKIMSIINVSIDSLNVQQDGPGKILITITGTNAEAAAKQLEGLNAQQQKDLGLSNFAPASSPGTNSPGSVEPGKNNMVPIIAGAVGGVILLVVIFTVIIVRRRASRSIQPDTTESHAHFNIGRYSQFGEQELNEGGPMV